jgi:hypothetical protein
MDSNAHLLDELLGDVLHVPVRGRVAHMVREIPEDLLTRDGVSHLGMELKTEDFPNWISDGSVLGIRSVCDLDEAGRHPGYLVAVGHPHLRMMNTLEDQLSRDFVLLSHVYGGAPILTIKRRLDFTPEVKSDFLHSVTNSQDGDVVLLNQLPNRTMNMRRVRRVHRRRSTGENNTDYVVNLQRCRINQARIQFTEHV